MMSKRLLNVRTITGGVKAWRRCIVTKTSTGIVGLEVDLNGRANLIVQCENILEALKGIPETNGYRQDTEKIVKYRLETAMKFEDEEMIEEEIGQGQLEELLEHGEDELKLIQMYIDEKMWEQVDGQEFTNQEIFLPEADEQPGAQETKKEA